MNTIGWCDETHNVIVGCTKCSPGCLNCYAERFAVRHCRNPKTKAKYEGTIISGHWSGICRLSEKELQKPFTWKKPRTIFLNSMGDTFHESVPFEWIDRVMAVIALNSHHKFIILTKRPERMREYFYTPGTCILVGIRQQIEKMGYPDIGAVGKVLPNLALGVTAENQEMADLRIPILLQIPAAVRFVSIEPILGPVNLTKLDAEAAGNKECWFINALTGDHDDMGRPCPPVPKLDWVISGSETGPGARTFSGMAEAIVDLKSQCESAGVPFFYKGPKNISELKHAGKSTLYQSYCEDKKRIPVILGEEYRQRPAGW